MSHRPARRVFTRRAIALLAASSPDEPSPCLPRLHQTSHQAITLLAVSSPDEPSSIHPARRVFTRRAIALLVASSPDEPSPCSPRLHQTSHRPAHRVFTRRAIALLAASSLDEPSPCSPRFHQTSHRPAWTVTSRMEIHNLQPCDRVLKYSGTHIDHGDLLGPRARVVGSVRKVSVLMISTHVLPQMVMHLLSLFPAQNHTEDNSQILEQNKLEFRSRTMRYCSEYSATKNYSDA
ncbi:UNVERIFIED_CONTAM: hypothetical protein FKN15_042229 [Acipenser sinensis]